jgi:hypothetical protein
VVLARSDRGLEVALSAAQIEACGGSPAALIAAIAAIFGAGFARGS